MEFDPKRSLYLNDDINPQSSLEIVLGISKLYSEDPMAPITLFITSAGGNIVDAFALYEYVTKVLKPNLQTVVLGEASSMAVLLFMMGSKRCVGEMAVIRFHRFSLTPNGVAIITLPLTDKIRKSLGGFENKYAEVIANQSCNKISKKRVKSFLRNETSVSATKAKELGLAHEIL